MVFPISDDNSDVRTTPYVNWALIAVNLLVFAAFQRFGSNERFTYAWATVPEKIRTGHNIDKEVTVEDPITGREEKRRVGLPAAKLLHRRERSEALEASLQIARERGFIEALPLADRHRAGELFCAHQGYFSSSSRPI